MKPYIFNGNYYNDLNSLGIAYKENFDLGVKDIFNNTKALIKFVKSQTKNKDRIKNVLEDIAYSKYKENALTFIIFEFLDIKEVIINGVSLKFNDFVNELKANPDPNKNILFGFLEDHGITRCYKRLEPDKKMFQDSYYIERNFKDPFTYLYLTKILNFEVKEQPEKKLQSIAIGNEECFRRATKVINNDDFMLAIAKRFGFKEAIRIKKDKNPVFYTVKLFNSVEAHKKEITEDELKRLISNTFFWWLLDNYKNYMAKKKAKNIMIRLNLIKEEINKYKAKIKSKEISNIAFDYYCEISRKLYLCYLDFIRYYKDGLITIKSLNKEQFELDKPYCKTFICEDYMRGKVIKLYDPNKKSEAKYNVLTGELIEEAEENNELSYDDVSNDNPIDEIDYISDEKIYKKDVNGIKKNKRFAAFILVSMIFLTLIVAMGLIFKHISFGKYENNKYIVAIRETYSFVYTVSGFVCAGIVLISSLTYLILMNKKYDAYYDYCYYKKANTKEELSLKQEARVYHIEKRLNKIVKFVTQEHRFTSVFLTVFYSLLSSIAGVIIACAIGNIWPKLYDAKELLENIIYMACSLVIPVVISLLIATFKKNKGFWIYLFITILAIGLSVGLAFVL